MGPASSRAVTGRTSDEAGCWSLSLDAAGRCRCKLVAMRVATHSSARRLRSVCGVEQVHRMHAPGVHARAPQPRADLHEAAGIAGGDEAGFRLANVGEL